MPRKAGYQHISIQMTPEQYRAIKGAAGKQGIAAYIRSMFAANIPEFPNDMPERGKYERPVTLNPSREQLEKAYEMQVVETRARLSEIRRACDAAAERGDWEAMQEWNDEGVALDKWLEEIGANDHQPK